MIASALAQTHAAAFTQTRPWSAAEFADLLAQRGVILCGDAKSFVLGRLIGDEAEILTLATHPDHQRQGLAKAQLSTFLMTIRAQGACTVFLEVSETNTPAKKLYFKENFKIVGHRKNYYTSTDGTQIGADVLRLSFGADPSTAQI